jgi:predicted histone-like DNA-binding protein
MYYTLNQCKGLKTSTAHNKWFAKAVAINTVDTKGLVDHMSVHHTAYSKGVIAGVITDAISCIKELILAGNNVKLDDLAIFSGSIVNKTGAETAQKFSLSDNVDCVKIKARGTGTMSRKHFSIDSSLENAPTYKTPQELDGGATETQPTSGSGTTSGSGSGGGTTGGGSGSNLGD